MQKEWAELDLNFGGFWPKLLKSGQRIYLLTSASSIQALTKINKNMSLVHSPSPIMFCHCDIPVCPLTVHALYECTKMSSVYTWPEVTFEICCLKLESWQLLKTLSIWFTNKTCAVSEKSSNSLFKKERWTNSKHKGEGTAPNPHDTLTNFKFVSISEIYCLFDRHWLDVSKYWIIICC